MENLPAANSIKKSKQLIMCYANVKLWITGGNNMWQRKLSLGEYDKHPTKDLCIPSAYMEQ